MGLKYYKRATVNYTRYPSPVLLFPLPENQAKLFIVVGVLVIANSFVITER